LARTESEETMESDEIEESGEKKKPEEQKMLVHGLLPRWKNRDR
jgi:hypothetical protein